MRTLSTLLVVLTLTMVIPVMAAPYYGARYNDGRGAVCRTTSGSSSYYILFSVPTAAGGLTAPQRAQIMADRLNYLWNPQQPYRASQICYGISNGETVIYIANRYNNNWLITTIDSKWARSQGVSKATAAKYWRDRMRWLATHYVQNANGQWERILTCEADSGMRPQDLKRLADPKACDKFPLNYEKRSPNDPPLRGPLQALPGEKSKIEPQSLGF